MRRVQLPPWVMPHDVDSHGVLVNAPLRLTPSSTHQPRSWSKAEALLNIPAIDVTPDMSHVPMSWLKAEASLNILYIVVTPEVSHAVISSLK